MCKHLLKYLLAGLSSGQGTRASNTLGLSIPYWCFFLSSATTLFSEFIFRAWSSCSSYSLCFSSLSASCNKIIDQPERAEQKYKRSRCSPFARGPVPLHSSACQPRQPQPCCHLSHDSVAGVEMRAQVLGLQQLAPLVPKPRPMISLLMDS